MICLEDCKEKKNKFWLLITRAGWLAGLFVTCHFYKFIFILNLSLDFQNNHFECHT